MNTTAILPRPLGPTARILAGVLALLMIWVLPTFLSEWRGATGFSWGSILQSAVISYVVICFLRAAVTGWDTSVWSQRFGLDRDRSGRATTEQLEHLRKLGVKIPRRLRNENARRLIERYEARLPATPAQQLALLRAGSPKGVFTRLGAAQFLQRVMEDELYARQREWAAGWAEAGLTIHDEGWWEPAQMETFDSAYADLTRQGLEYPLPAHVGLYDLAREIARMRIAAGFLAEASRIQAKLAQGGIIQRPLDPTEIRALFPAYARLLRANVVEPADARTLLALLHRQRPGLICDHARGWEADAFVRRRVEEESWYL